MDAHYNNETSNWQRFHSKLHFQLSSAFLRYFHEICNITPCIIVLRDRVKIHLILRVFFFTFMLYMRVVVKKCYSLNVGTFGNLKVKYFSWKWYQISRLFCIIFSSSSFIILTIVSFKSCKISIQTPFSFKKYLSYYMRTSTILLCIFLSMMEDGDTDNDGNDDDGAVLVPVELLSILMPLLSSRTESILSG